MFSTKDLNQLLIFLKWIEGGLDSNSEHKRNELATRIELELERRKKPANGWRCPDCGTDNPNFTDNCLSLCNYPRPKTRASKQRVG
jgi:hypothetical protein